MSSITPMYRRAGVICFSALLVMAILGLAVAPVALAAEPAHQGGGEANLKIPDLGQVQFLGVGGRSLLMAGLVRSLI